MAFNELYVSIAVILLNAVPSFMPPTWVFLAYIHITQGGDILQLVVLGAICSTIGRIVLAKWSGPLVSQFLNKPMKNNAEFAKEKLSHNPLASFVFTFLYALSPFPSNAVFIIAGAAGLGLIPIALGFFLGRLISYYVLVLAAGFTAGAIGMHLVSGASHSWLLDIIGIALSFAFLLIDWKALLRPFLKKSKK